MKNMLMLISDGFEEIEALGTVDILRRCGVQTQICSVTGSRQIQSSRNIHLLCDRLLEDSPIQEEVWDGLVLPGGQPNADHLRDDRRVIELTDRFYRAGKLCCAICAAPIVLERAGLLKGKTVTSYPGCLEREQDCNFVEQAAVTDGQLITGRGPGAAEAFAFQIVRALGLSEKAKEVRSAMLF